MSLGCSVVWQRMIYHRGKEAFQSQKEHFFGDDDENYVDEDNNDDYAAFEMRLVYNHLSCWGSSLFSLDPQCDPHITKH